ncbi:diadenosine tetraphosphate (Ap4A) HIT family hydrolase [Herbaspirillum sp. Sphag1AN]|uniref:HIT family protein n=1 Tax=unclassified Herbaspirillum TaxID=2624150 RepID=UPI00183622CD|nr:MULTISPECIES: HIT family protein [unclassified Herbaspirillum]MBB3212812.1 diadenosine tetraphosphate (Ap4A) HIT family hydrolase [Herbaspirillum sp. Sphag1AN]MBB3246009.1 diadenosine tetraphosphate (Ap4A) HIT family hydrolase [Herbaspirillum sp. Sphag64]
MLDLTSMTKVTAVTSATATCELCESHGGELLFDGGRYRVVLIDDAAYPGFCRVIWNAHVKEMTDLTTADRTLLMAAVWAVEAAQREVLQPEKINLASLGNMTPHVHWHVIPRYVDDVQFPSPIWADARRVASEELLSTRRTLLPALRQAILRQLQALA